jgi:hypothetical protein
MSLSDNERLIIVKREMEKAKRTFDDTVFNANEDKWEAAIEPTRLMIEKVDNYIKQ